MHVKLERSVQVDGAKLIPTHHLLNLRRCRVDGHDRKVRHPNAGGDAERLNGCHLGVGDARALKSQDDAQLRVRSARLSGGRSIPGQFSARRETRP